jgi:hypothetical protein
MKTLLLSISCVTFLIASTTALAQSSIQQNSVQINDNGVCVTSNDSKVNLRNSASTSRQSMNSFQEQKVTININSSNLDRPHILNISSNRASQLTGEVTVNGVVVKKINNDQNSIDLSPYLSKGRKTVRISGSYKPAQSSVQIGFSGPGVQVSQQTSGEGVLRQTLILNVQ